jgi:hypothetical protein
VAGDETQELGTHTPKSNRDTSKLIATQHKVEGLLRDTVEDYSLVEVGGGGDCFYATMSDQIFCDGGEQKTYLRTATAQYLLHNKLSFPQEFMVLDCEGPVAVEDYASRVATTGKYAGHVEIAIMAKLTQHDIVVHSTDHGCTRTVRVDNSGRSKQHFPTYSIAHLVADQHFQSVRSPAWTACQARLQISPRTFSEEGSLLKGISFTSTGRFTENRISGGGACGQVGFKNVVILQSGTFTNSITPFTQVMIVGEDPSPLALAEAKKRGIVTVSYALLRVCIRWEITSNVFVQMGKYMGERVDVAIRGESGLVPSSITQVVS